MAIRTGPAPRDQAEAQRLRVRDAVARCRRAIGPYGAGWDTEVGLFRVRDVETLIEAAESNTGDGR